MVTDFWGVETHGAGLRACVASTRLWREVDSRQYRRSLKSTGCKGGLIIYHGVMLKVKLESEGLHSVLIEGLRRKLTESRSLFSGKKRVTRSLDWSPMV